MIKFKYTRTLNSESILVQQGDVIRTIASSNPRFNDVRDYLLSTDESELDEAHVLSMIDAGPEALNSLTRLSERVTFNGQYLFFDGDKLDNSISNHIVRMIKGGDNAYESFVLFLENLATNPDRRARRELFTWIQDRNFTITTDGRFIAYKGVQNVPENLSISKGVETVWVNGKEHVGYIPNPIGATVEMARSLVDDGAHVACSTGLHAGTHNYASNFGRKLLLVAINPRDVVSVPRDSSFEKLRVCRYEVLDNAGEQLTETTYGRHAWNGAEPVANAPEDAVQCDGCGLFTDGSQYCDNCTQYCDNCTPEDDFDDVVDCDGDECPICALFVTNQTPDSPESDSAAPSTPSPAVSTTKSRFVARRASDGVHWAVVEVSSGREYEAGLATRKLARETAKRRNNN